MIKKARNRKGQSLDDFLYTTIIGGLTILLPLYLTILFVQKILEIIRQLFGPFIQPLESLIPYDTAIIEPLLAIIILIVICFLAGFLMKTSLGLMIENSVKPKLEKLPGYYLFSSLTRQVTGFGEKEELQVVLVALGALDESLSIGFVIDYLQDTGYVVFVPSVPTTPAGDIFIIPENKVFPIDISFTHAVQFLSQWGKRSGEVLEAIHQLRKSQKLNQTRIPRQPE